MSEVLIEYDWKKGKEIVFDDEELRLLGMKSYFAKVSWLTGKDIYIARGYAIIKVKTLRLKRRENGTIFAEVEQ